MLLTTKLEYSMNSYNLILETTLSKHWFPDIQHDILRDALTNVFNLRSAQKLFESEKLR